VDLDEGVGAFASINAMQGYRPNPVAQYAIQLMRAQRGGKELPVAPEIRAATYIENVADFAGAYHSVDGRVLNFLAEGGHLSFIHKDQKFLLEASGDGVFVAPDADFSRFSLAFGRADAKDPKSAVVEVGWGSDWFFKGPENFRLSERMERISRPLSK